MRPLRPCNKIGCNNLTRESYCKEHKHIIDEQRKERHKHYDKHQRDQDASKFYGSAAWRRVREQALMRDNGLCQHCLKDNNITHADMVDHIIPIRVDWSKRLDINNLQSLCNSCHAVKTLGDKRKYGDMM